MGGCRSASLTRRSPPARRPARQPAGLNLEEAGSMQLLYALALVAALCMGSGAASELRGAVRAEVGSNNACTCNLGGGGLVWPTSTCECSGACSGTCCYFSQPGQFDQLMSGCQCQGQTHNIFNTATTTTQCRTANNYGCTSNSDATLATCHSSVIGDNYYDYVGDVNVYGLNPWSQPPIPASWYTPAAAL